MGFVEQTDVHEHLPHQFALVARMNDRRAAAGVPQDRQCVSMVGHHVRGVWHREHSCDLVLPAAKAE
eukprot:scaffold15750_cov110-Isochrysis_galbana.AAC.6